MAMNEWELLSVADSIEQGDSLIVEHENGEQEEMVFVKEKGRSLVQLKDSNGVVRFFSAQNLEEQDGYSFIVGKA